MDEKLHVSAEDMPVPGQTGARIYATVPRCVEWRSGVWSGGQQTGTVPSVPPPTARVRVCVITNQQTIANNTCTQVYVLDGAWSVIHGLTINAVINEDCSESRLRPGSSHAPAARPNLKIPCFC